MIFACSGEPLGKLRNVNYHHHTIIIITHTSITYLINRINNIACLQIIRPRNNTKNSVLCPLFSTEPEINTKYIKSPLGHGASGGLRKIAQTQKGDNNDNNKVGEKRKVSENHQEFTRQEIYPGHIHGVLSP